MFRGALVDRDRSVAHALGEGAVADRADSSLEVDVLVVVADLRLRRGREERLGQLLGFA